MANLNDFIQVWDNSIDSETCDYLIKMYEENSVYSEPAPQPDSNYVQSELDFTAFRTTSNEINEIQISLIKKVYEYRDAYYEIFGFNVFPESHAFEHFRIIKLEPNDEEVSFTKVEVKSYEAARRYLTFTWFLNENPTGQYEFLDLFVQPEVGRLIVYPPFWLFPRKKHIPTKEPQYMLTTYLHYK